MKKFFLIALALFGGTVWAEWLLAGETDEGNLYIDTLSVRRDGSMRQVWELTDLRQRDEGGELSRRTLVQYDCARDRTKVLSTSTYSEPMTAGITLVSVAREGLWKEVPPGTAYAKAFIIVCAQ